MLPLQMPLQMIAPCKVLTTISTHRSGHADSHLLSLHWVISAVMSVQFAPPLVPLLADGTDFWLVYLPFRSPGACVRINQI
jgi:hypothetical protein